MGTTDTAIPDHWTSEQAMFVIEFLDLVIGAVWDRYEPGLVALCIEEATVLAYQEAERQLPDVPADNHYDDDDIPF